MFERFTDRARKAMALAQQEARNWNHEYIGTEHQLLGLYAVSEGVAANVLRNAGVTLEQIRGDVLKLVKIGPEGASPPHKLPETPRAKNVIDFAHKEARRLNHNYIGTEHLLLGIVEEEKGVAAQVLKKRGLTQRKVRGTVL